MTGHLTPVAGCEPGNEGSIRSETLQLQHETSFGLILSRVLEHTTKSSLLFRAGDNLAAQVLTCMCAGQVCQ